MQSEPLPPEEHSAETAAAPMTEASVFEGRLHPLTLVFGLLRGLRGILPLIPLLLFGNRAFGFGLIIISSVLTIFSVLWRYFSFRYRIEGHDLITEQGVLSRTQRHIPLDRIQEIRIDQGVIQRMFGVVEAKVETGGGGGSEASLSVLSRSDAENLRRVVFDRVKALRSASAGDLMGAAPGPGSTVVKSTGIGDLVLAGITTNHIVSALVLAGAIWNFADDLLPDTIYRAGANFIYKFGREVLEQDALTTLLATLAGILAIFTIGMIFSVIGSVLLFFDFTLARKGDDLQRRYGLLTRRTSSLPRRRIQVLEIEQKMLRRIFRLATLRVDTSGVKREGSDDNQGRDVLLPIVHLDEVDALLPFIFPDLPADRADWRRVSPLAIWRGTKVGALICLLIAGVLLYRDPSWPSLWPLALIPLIHYNNKQNYKHLGYSLGERYFLTRRGWLGRSTHIVPLNKIQAVEITQTPFDKRLGLASIRVDTAGQAYTEGGPQISNLPVDEARSLAAILAKSSRPQ